MAVANVVALAKESICKHGLRLSIENSGGLSLKSMGLLLLMARRQLPPQHATELGEPVHSHTDQLTT